MMQLDRGLDQTPWLQIEMELLGPSELGKILYVKKNLKHWLQNVHSTLYPAMQLWDRKRKENFQPDISPLIPIYCHPGLSQVMRYLTPRVFEKIRLMVLYQSTTLFYGFLELSLIHI